MSDNCISVRGKLPSGGVSALDEGLSWFDELMDALFQGRGDRDKTVRGRVSDETGIPDSYCFRLQYKRDEMKRIDGEAYRGLMLAYDRICKKHEDSACAARRKRLRIEGEISESCRNRRSGERSPLV